MRPRLRKLDGELSCQRSTKERFRVRLRISGHACGSTTEKAAGHRGRRHLRICARTDVARDLEDRRKPSSGFVPLDSLLRHAPVAHASMPAEAVGADGSGD